MGILGKFGLGETDDENIQFEVVAASWGDEEEPPDPDPSVALCEPCGGNPVWWSDPYGGRHCGGCEPPPARPLVKSIDVAVRVPGGLAWEDQTESLWDVMWDSWDPKLDDEEEF